MDKMIFFLEIKFYFFPAFRKNYWSRVRKSTNKKIWPNTAYLQMAYFKKNYNFPRFQGGRGRGNFFQGMGQIAYCYGNLWNLWISREGPDLLSPTPSGSTHDTVNKDRTIYRDRNTSWFRNFYLWPLKIGNGQFHTHIINTYRNTGILPAGLVQTNWDIRVFISGQEVKVPNSYSMHEDFNIT